MLFKLACTTLSKCRTEVETEEKGNCGDNTVILWCSKDPVLVD